jgi:hypothetical protein
MIKYLKPKKCCGLGTYKCTVPMPIKGRKQDIDLCVADIVASLNAANIPTDMSCCGHNIMPGIVCLEDGRELIIVKNREDRNRIFDMMKKKSIKGE